MTRYPIFGSAQPDAPFPPTNVAGTPAPPENGDRALPAGDLEAALQLLVERARYITGATGAALALLQGEEMVCRASAGSSAPAIGARLQVISGLTGESVARKQLLRCDNAENDPRVNLAACRELGIASIVVLPLLARTGEVRGLFELFSDHAYAFEERDLIALERMADLTRTALDLSEKRDLPLVVAPRPQEIPPALSPESKTASVPTSVVETGLAPSQDLNGSVREMQQAGSPPYTEAALSPPQVSPSPMIPQQELPAPAPPPIVIEEPPAELETPPLPVPEAMLRVHKCASCGFPISEGRTRCMDCEGKQPLQTAPAELMPAEDVPTFLSSQKPPSNSWLADHVNILAIIVLILSILVAVVVFR
jgi:putative methionine-R-sulfoxide reductase with GAF domain